MGLFEALIAWYLPTELKKQWLVDWLTCLTYPAQTLHEDFEAYKTSVLYRLDFNGQVISLERLLNNKYDNALRRIYITDNTEKVETFLFYDLSTVLNNEEAWLFEDGTTNEANETFWLTQEDYTGIIDFYINIPAGIAYNATELTALVNQCRIASKKFQILEY